MKYIPADNSLYVAASHENPDRPGVLKRVIATASDFQRGQIQMLNWARLPGRSAFQRHYHEDMQETFILLTGQVEMSCGSQTVVMQPGDTVIVEPR